MPQTLFGKIWLFCVVAVFGYVTYTDGYRLYEKFVPSVRDRRIAEEKKAVLTAIAEEGRLRAATLSEQIPALIGKIAAGHTDPETVAQLDGAVLEWRRLHPPTAIDMRDLLKRTTEEDRVRYYSKLVSDNDSVREAVTAAGARNDRSAFVSALTVAALNPNVSYQFVSSQINRLRRDTLYRDAFDTFKRRVDDAVRKMREAAGTDPATVFHFVPELRDALQSFYNATRDTLYTYPVMIREERIESKHTANEFAQRFIKIYGEGRDGVRSKAARDERSRQAIQLVSDYVGTPIALERFNETLGRITADVQAIAEPDKRSGISPAPLPLPPLAAASKASLPSLLKPATDAIATWKGLVENNMPAGRRQTVAAWDAIRDFYTAARANGHSLPLSKEEEEGPGKQQGLLFHKRFEAMYPGRTSSPRARFQNAIRLIEENLGKPIAYERFYDLIGSMNSDVNRIRTDTNEPLAAAPLSYEPRSYAPVVPPFFPRIIVR